MKQETLKKAKDLEKDISEYRDLLLSRKADYHTMLIKITCAYSNNRTDYHGRVSKEVWDKMLDVVAEERRKAMRELENLTDDPYEEIVTDTPETGRDAFDPAMAAMATSFELDKPRKATWKDYAVKTIDRMISWMLYSMTFYFLFIVAGLELSVREIFAYSLMLGLVTGSINNLERVIRELFGKKEE